MRSPLRTSCCRWCRLLCACGTRPGRRRRVSVSEGSRFLAARIAEEQVRHETRAAAVAESVSLRLSGELLVHAADESQGIVDHFVTVTDPRGEQQLVRVAADRRADAIRQAEAEVRGRVEAVLIKYAVLGRCAACRVHLFADVKVRRDARNRLKCADCP